MEPSEKSHRWPTSSEINTTSGSLSQPFGETYFERLARTQGFIVPNYGSFPNALHIPDSEQPAHSESSMTGSTAMQLMPAHAWPSETRSHMVANSGPMANSAVPRSRFDQLLRAKMTSERISQEQVADPQPAQPCSASAPSRFEQLVRTKLAAEQQSGTAPRSPPLASSAGFNAALAKMQNADTVFNTGFIRQHYNGATAEKDSQDGSSSGAPSGSQQTFYGYPLSSQECSGFDSSIQPNQPSVPPPLEPTPTPVASQQLTADFRSMIAARINNMYATIQAQGNSDTPRVEASAPSPNYQAYPTSPVDVSHNLPAPYHSVAPSMSMSSSGSTPHVPTTPSYKYANSCYDSQPTDVKPSFEAYQNMAYPFIWNVTPPQNPHAEMPAHSGKTHSASDSMESRMSVSPLTPQHVPYSQLALQVDVKPIISPASSTISLPRSETSTLSYARYGPGLFANMNGQPQYTSASGEQQTNGSNGGGMYDGSHGINSNSMDGTNGLGDLGFPQDNGDGSGNGDENDESQNGDDGGNSGPGGSMPRGKKLPLACHFCRRRKLKCDGVKPTCENCRKRGQECTFDDHVRRRGPGKRTKEMRDRAARDAEAGGIMSAQALAAHQAALAQSQDTVDLDSHEQGAEVELGENDLILDPALAGEDGGPRHSDVMEAMGALKQAGIDLGLHDDDDGLGEPSTLAEIGDLDAMKEFKDFDRFDDFQKEDSEETRKRKELEGLGDYDSQGDMKRMRLSTGELNELELLQHVENVQQQQAHEGQQ